MNLGGIVASMSLPGSMVTRESNDVPDQFPAGLRVLVVDDDLICLTILEKMLRDCRYKVTKANRAEEALRLLRENRSGYDIVISDVHMPDIDGFNLLERVGLEMDLPVIMMSADDSKNVVMKGVTHGACDYLIKPVRIEALKNIWQHVIRKKKNGWKDIEQSGSWDEGDRHRKQDEVVSSPANDGGWKNSKRKGDDEDTDDRDDSATLKKPRVVWSVELHQQFVAAVNQLGIDKAVPKKILELMNVPGLTRANVASHLQKYRLYLRRISGVSQYQGGLNNSYMPQNLGFSTMTSLGGIDLQTLAATGQLAAHTLAKNTQMITPPSTSKPQVGPSQGQISNEVVGDQVFDTRSPLMQPNNVTTSSILSENKVSSFSDAYDFSLESTHGKKAMTSKGLNQEEDSKATSGYIAGYDVCIDLEQYKSQKKALATRLRNQFLGMQKYNYQSLNLVIPLMVSFVLLFMFYWGMLGEI